MTPHLRHSGFSLLELVVTTTVLLTLIGIGLPVTLSFVRSYALKNERDTLVTLLEWARDQSLANTGQASHGVEITGNSFTGFVGTTYATRNIPFDLIDPHSSSISVTGAQELVFAPLTGATTAKTIQLSNGEQQVSIIVNAEGTIDW